MRNASVIGEGMTTKERLLQLMLYREAGGVGYDPAIKKLVQQVPEYYVDVADKVRAIKLEKT